MKVKLKVAGLRTTEGKTPQKAIAFVSPYGEKISAYCDVDDPILEQYPLNSIHVLDLYAYKGQDGQCRIGVKLDRPVTEAAF